MATYYLDFEGGNDANDGTTFANRWKTLTSGATLARIAAGDTVRIMGSPDPTNLGQNGVWSSGALQGTKTITGATNATPISITCVGHGYSTGDTVVITGVGGNTNANGTWEITSTGVDTFTLDSSAGNSAFTSGGTARLRNNSRVMLTTAVTQNIASTGAGRVAWTAVAGGNVTTTFDTTNFKEHNQADSIAIAAGFTTGLAAYWPLPATLNLSGYQQVSFWIRQTTGTLGAAGAVDLRLCSDTAGATAVNTISIPNLGALNRWMPVTVDLGTSLGSSIRSIALYINTDNGAQTFLLNNIIACKASSAADSLTLTSLISKNTTGETFWGIQSISGRRVMLDADTNATPTSTNVRGYYGSSATTTTWKRETIKLGPAATTTTALQTIQDSGTDGNPIVFSGGWDRTAMSTQTLETWVDGLNGLGWCILSQVNFVTLSKLAVVRCSSAYEPNSVDTKGHNVTFVAANNNSSGSTSGAVTLPSKGSSCTIDAAVANGGNAIRVSTNQGGHLSLIGTNISSNANSGLYLLNSAVGDIYTVKAYNNGGYGIDARGTRSESILRACSTQDNGTGGVDISAGVSMISAQSLQCSETIEVDTTTLYASALFSHDHDQTLNNHKIFAAGGLISAATDQRKTASGISWKMQPTSTARSSTWPLTLSLAKVAVAAAGLVTIKAWMLRNNAGLTMRLVCKGGQIDGVPNDVVASVTLTNTWEEETITFTPMVAGVVEIVAEAYGGTTYSGWVDDMTISQA